MLNKSIYDSSMTMVKYLIDNFMTWSMSFSACSKAILAKVYWASVIQFHNILRFLAAACVLCLPRARLSPVIKYRGHDCLHLLYLPSYLCSHYHCLSPPHSFWCWSQNTRHHFSGLVWYLFLHICKISTKYLLLNNFCVKSIKISKKDDKDEIKFWIYISCYNFLMNEI